MYRKLEKSIVHRTSSKEWRTQRPDEEQEGQEYRQTDEGGQHIYAVAGGMSSRVHPPASDDRTDVTRILTKESSHEHRFAP
jgi:hypothetical protein